MRSQSKRPYPNRSSREIMGKAPCGCCDKEEGLMKGLWSHEEDKILIDYVKKNGPVRWKSIRKKTDLRRCGKGCRMRWINYLRPNINHAPLTPQEEKLIVDLHSQIGNRWGEIVSHLPGRTHNQIKNYLTTHLKKQSMNHMDPTNNIPPSNLHQNPTNHDQPFLSLSPTTIKSEDDHLLAMWNSEIGESFRRLYNINNGNGSAKIPSDPMSLVASSSTVMTTTPGIASRSGEHELDKEHD